MKGSLSSNQIDYILFHLNQIFSVNDAIRAKFVFAVNPNISEYSNQIIFPLSNNGFEKKEVFSINDIPTLFPLNKKPTFYEFIDGNLVFNHDLLKSAFYLLSGYQEFNSNNTDQFGRFKYENSIQKEFGFVQKPIVNYYFEIIKDGIKSFCELHSIKFEEKRLFEDFGFFLTHDIDSVDFYTINRFLYKIKEIFGLVNSRYTFKTKVKHLLKCGFELLKFNRKENPNWNFEYLINLEKKNSLKSAFYFLRKDVKHSDSTYLFSEKRIQDLFEYIHSTGNEIGLHATVNSSIKPENMKRDFEYLQNHSPQDVIGNRQHRLLCSVPQTQMYQSNAGLKYDTTLCFAEHAGFRNSYCLPFKLFDFDHDKMIDIWEIPLNVMDVTLFHYQNLDLTAALDTIESIINEIKKFGGIFTLLWHNSHFDEDLHPGIRLYYENLLEKISKMNSESLIGKDILKKLQ